MSLKSNQQMIFHCDTCALELVLESKDPEETQDALESWWTVGKVIAADEWEDPNEKARPVQGPTPPTLKAAAKATL